MGNIHKKYNQLFGFSCKEREIEAVNLRVEIQESADFFVKYTKKGMVTKVPNPVSFQNIFYKNNPVKAPVYRREGLPTNRTFKGPCIIVDEFSTIVIDPDLFILSRKTFAIIRHMK